MLRFLKTCLIWLLMLALPAQAVAAAAGSSCAMRHHASPAQPAVAHAWQAQPAQPAADLPSPDHAAMPGTTAKADGTIAKHKSGTCSVCASSCVGTAVIPAIADWKPATANSFIAIMSPAPAFTAHIPTGLERPPRPYLV